MRGLRMLAASSKPLWIAILDTIRAKGGSFAHHVTTHSGLDRNDQLSLDLEPDDEDRTSTGTAPSLHPRDPTAAVLLGRAFEHRREALARLRDPDTVALIEVPTSDLVQPIRHVLRKYMLGTTAVLDVSDLHGTLHTIELGATVIFAPSDDTKPDKSSYDDVHLAHAIQLRASIIGVTASQNDLPRTLLDLAEHRIAVDAIDAEVVSEVIAAVTGKRPRAIDEWVGRRATIERLSIADAAHSATTD